MKQKNPNWKGNAVSDSGARRRAQTNFKLGLCEDCGKPGVDRHHNDGNVRNNSKKNISILCRRCHMERDGRLKKFKAIPKRKKSPPTLCKNCKELSKPLRKGRCSSCSAFYRRTGRERPGSRGWRLKAIRERGKLPCSDCGKKAGRYKGIVISGRCVPCYKKYWRRMGGKS